jgi:hypothetical protein
MNAEQYNKYSKIYETNPDILIHAKDTKGNLHFLIQGTKRYRVSILSDSGKVECTCPDFKHHSSRQKKPSYLCKHCMLVVTDKLNIFGSRIMEHTFFKRGWYSADELYSLHNKFETLGKYKIIKT